MIPHEHPKGNVQRTSEDTKIFRSVAQIEKKYFPKKYQKRILRCINGYNTICPDCHGPMPERYIGQPKIMRCPKCWGKHAAEQNVKNAFVGVKEL